MSKSQFPPDMEEAIERFIAEEPDKPSRDVAVERLVRESLEKLGILDLPNDP